MQIKKYSCVFTVYTSCGASRSVIKDADTVNEMMGLKEEFVRCELGHGNVDQIHFGPIYNELMGGTAGEMEPVIVFKKSKNPFLRRHTDEQRFSQPRTQKARGTRKGERAA